MCAERPYSMRFLPALTLLTTLKTYFMLLKISLNTSNFNQFRSPDAVKRLNLIGSNLNSLGLAQRAEYMDVFCKSGILLWREMVPGLRCASSGLPPNLLVISADLLENICINGRETLPRPLILFHLRDVIFDDIRYSVIPVSCELL